MAEVVIYWMGGEDLDFSFGDALTFGSAAGRFRSGYARGYIYPTLSNTLAKSNIFSGGEITSGWLASQYWWSDEVTNRRKVGFGKSGTTKGLYWGHSNTAANKIALFKYDGATMTQLAAESGNTFIGYTLHKICMSIVSYGASATVKVYVDTTEVISYTGDVSISGVSGFDSVFISSQGDSYPQNQDHSEIMVADGDIRAISVVTVAPNAAGDANQWDGGVYSDIDETTIDDNDLVYVNSADKDAQFNLGNLPTTQLRIISTKIVARAWKSADASVGTLKLGVKSGGSVDVDAGRSLTTSPVSYERLAATFNGSVLTPTLANALQLDLRSAS